MLDHLQARAHLRLQVLMYSPASQDRKLLMMRAPSVQALLWVEEFR